MDNIVTHLILREGAEPTNLRGTPIFSGASAYEDAGEPTGYLTADGRFFAAADVLDAGPELPAGHPMRASQVEAFRVHAAFVMVCGAAPRAISDCCGDPPRYFFASVVRRDGTVALPGGKVDLGETPAEAASRELHEETGLTTPAYLLRFRGIMQVDGRPVAGFTDRRAGLPPLRPAPNDVSPFWDAERLACSGPYGAFAEWLWGLCRKDIYATYEAPPRQRTQAEEDQWQRDTDPDYGSGR